MALLSPFLPLPCCRAMMIAPSSFQSGICFCLSQLSADSNFQCNHLNVHTGASHFFFLNHHFMAKPRDWQAVKKQRKHISSDAVLRHSKARRICHEIRDHKCKSLLHIHTCTDIFDSDHDVSVVPRLSGSPEKNWQLFPWSKPPLSWAQLTLELLLGDFLRFVIVTQRDESRFLSSQLIKFLLLQIIYHTPTAPRLVYYPQPPEASKPILVKSV